MAIYHLSIKIGSRGKGQSAIAAAAYRSGEKLTDTETGLISDYTRKGGVVFSEISLCENAPAEYSDRATLWNAVHQIEKNSNAQLWREFEVALPQELSRKEQIQTVRDFVKGLNAQGMCVDWSLHDKGDGNPHAHIMTTMRSITEDGKWAPKSRLVYDLDEQGKRIFQKVNKQGRKQYKSHKEDYNNWNAAERVEEWRAAWAECCNARLADRDHIDHRSYVRQGIDQIPTVHEGYVARQLEAKGLVSERVQLNNEIRLNNTLMKQIAMQLRTIGEQIKQMIAEEQIKKDTQSVSHSEQFNFTGKRTDLHYFDNTDRMPLSVIASISDPELKKKVIETFDELCSRRYRYTTVEGNELVITDKGKKILQEEAAKKQAISNQSEAPKFNFTGKRTDLYYFENTDRMPFSVIASISDPELKKKVIETFDELCSRMYRYTTVEGDEIVITDKGKKMLQNEAFKRQAMTDQLESHNNPSHDSQQIRRRR